MLLGRLESGENTSNSRPDERFDKVGSLPRQMRSYKKSILEVGMLLENGIEGVFSAHVLNNLIFKAGKLLGKILTPRFRSDSFNNVKAVFRELINDLSSNEARGSSDEDFIRRH